jgi:hypothetical protein
MAPILFPLCRRGGIGAKPANSPSTWLTARRIANVYWRQFIHLMPDGRAALFYNSGYNGREPLYLKGSEKS